MKLIQNLVSRDTMQTVNCAELQTIVRIVPIEVSLKLETSPAKATHFQIEMQDLLAVHEFDALAYLAHENGAAALRQYKIIVYHSLEELAAVDP